ncbi:MAG TPA: cytochrome c, partial [Allosphingosinicella sp.]|nr:cytochrome c [Allosphingosinicella sp.]
GAKGGGMKSTPLLAAALVAIPLTAALAQNETPAAGITAEQIVGARQSVMFLSGGHLTAMKVAVNAGADVRHLYASAMSLAVWARTLPTMFPANSNVPPTNARAEVWSDRAGFEAAATAYAEAANGLVAASLAGDPAVFLERFNEVRGACATCHAAYKND